MVHPILTLINKPSRLVIGFMSGTSADGIDAVLAEIHGHGTAARVKQREFVFMPFEPEVRAEILRLAGGGAAAAADFCRMNFLLGELYCDAGRELCRHAGVRTEDIDLIGNHGQTFWHIPLEEKYLGHKLHGTLQLGEDAMLAEAFSCPVVGDFRVRDMAAGGLGAPLVPYTEFLLYRSETECVALQNIGGIGNISFLPAGCGLNDILAFDTGPGNMVMDAVTARMTDGTVTYDAGGALAAHGHVNEKLLRRMMADPYIAQRPRVQRSGAHGLFTQEEDAPDLNAAARAVSEHDGNIWTCILSLRREDAARLSYDKADAWRALLRANAAEIAARFNVPVGSFHWCGAFHNEAHHPHVHLVCYADRVQKPALTKEGVVQLRSLLARQIFRDELDAIYIRQSQSRDELRDLFSARLKEAVAGMRDAPAEMPVLESLLERLSEEVRDR